MKRICQQRGFTLIEVLVALTVLTIALLAVSLAANRNLHNIQAVSDRTIAHWVAMNTWVGVKTGLLPLAEDKTLKGDTFMANKKWYWQVIAKNSRNPGILEISITVTDRPQGARPLAHLVSFLRP